MPPAWPDLRFQAPAFLKGRLLARSTRGDISARRDVLQDIDLAIGEWLLHPIIREARPRVREMFCLLAIRPCYMVACGRFALWLKLYYLTLKLAAMQRPQKFHNR